jgi:hypothetical protein
VDSQVDVLHGPHPFQKIGTVTIPRDLATAVGLEPGLDQVHWALNPAIPGTLLVIPAKQMARAMQAILQTLADHA